MWLFISAILVGAAIGGTSNGIKAYNEGARGWSLFGAILGGAIVGGAMGGILTFGGVTALGVISGFSLASGLMLSTGIGIIAGWTSYSIEAAFRDNIKWNVFDFGLAGISGGLKGFATFGMGFMGGKLGAFDKIILNPLLKGAKTLDMSITYSLTKIIFGRTIFLTPIAEFLFKIVAISGISSGIRSLIDKLIKKLKK